MNKLTLPEVDSIAFPDSESAAFPKFPSLRSAPIDTSPFSQQHSPDKSLVSESLDNGAVGSTGGILALPDEILAHIFEEAHRTQELQVNDAPPVERVVPGVTQRWRNIALHTPRLWTRIFCLLRTEKEIEDITVYLQRSAMYPLEIFLLISSDDIIWRMELLEPYRQVFLRCHRLVIYAPLMPYFGSGNRASTMEHFVHFFKALAMPALYSFEMHGNAQSDYTPYVSQLFRTPPLLHRVVLVNPRIYCWYPRLMYCKTLLLVLSTLDIWSFHLEDALSLKQLEVDILFDSPDPDDGDTTFGPNINLILPSLRALTIASYEGSPNIFRFCLRSILSAPSLEVLCLRGYGLGGLASDTGKFPELRTLLWLAPGEEHSSHFHSVLNAFSIFKAFPSVERVVYSGPYPENFLHILDIQDPIIGVRWPQLRVVALAHTVLNSRPCATMLASILSANRSKAGAPINVVYLPPDLTRPWKSADRVKGELLDIQAYVGVLENAEAAI